MSGGVTLGYVFGVGATLLALAVTLLIFVKVRFTVREREFCGIVRLRRAVICMDCTVISEALGEQCPLCTSESLLALEAVLNRETEEVSHQLPPVDAQTRLIGGELVRLPAGAVMGAEMIAPEQRNVGRRDAVL